MDEVLFSQRGGLGVITLNRPRALNAITLGMVRAIRTQLLAWLEDAGVRRVAIIGSGERGLSAGGDIIELRLGVLDGDGAAGARFLYEEYQLYAFINEYPKPVVSFQDGIVLGGGVGISGHASHRIVTERSRVGFPEVTIGFIPDVGASWLLGRGRPGLGLRLALTGASAGPADAIAIGMSDTHVPSDRLGELLVALEREDADAAIERVATDAGATPLVDAADRWADDAFAAPTVAEVLDRLGTNEVAATIRTKSPEALAVAFEAMHRARSLPNRRAAFELEYLAGTARFDRPDFAEGVRAQVVDKDRNPHWSPSTIAEVDPVIVASHFEVGRHGELHFDLIPEGPLP